ncbi:ribonuclease P protein component [candidate division WOR-3 bacterium]|nr:ribonuclease P protein component [candidate division WOR-3 bacterium]
MKNGVIGKLKKKKEIEKLLAKGKKDYCTFIGIIHQPAGETRFSIGLRKGIKGAVARNKLRRRLKSVLMKRIAEIKLCSEFIVIAKKEAACLSFAELEKQLTTAMKKAGLI